MDYNLEDEKKSKDDVIILWKKIYVMLRIYL